VPHYDILSPLEDPLTYLLFALTWISCLVCVVLSFHFYRAKGQAWWLLIALAMALPLFSEVAIALSHGLPPLPYSLRYPAQEMISSASTPSFPQPDQPPLTGASTIIEYSVSRVQWSFGPPLIAIALVWAYFDDRKKRA
jgi:hypothetical protein